MSVWGVNRAGVGARKHFIGCCPKCHLPHPKHTHAYTHTRNPAVDRFGNIFAKYSSHYTAKGTVPGAGWQHVIWITCSTTERRRVLVVPYCVYCNVKRSLEVRAIPLLSSSVCPSVYSAWQFGQRCITTNTSLIRPCLHEGDCFLRVLAWERDKAATMTAISKWKTKATKMIFFFLHVD